MNVSDNNYGLKKSNLQILNIHVYENHKNLNSLLNVYTSFTDIDNIKSFYNNIKNKETKVIHYPHNNTSLINSLLNKNNIENKITKEARCGLSYIPIGVQHNKRIFMIGYSLLENDYTKHQINSKLKKVNDKGHDRNEEITILKKLHHKDIIDLTFSTLLNTPIPTLDNNILEPKKESIDILLNIYDHIEVVNKKKFMESKLSKFFLIKDNKVVYK